MVPGIVQLAVGVFLVVIAQHRLEQRQVDAYVRSVQAYDEELGRARSAEEIEKHYRRSQWAIIAIGVASAVVGAGLFSAAFLSA